MKLLIDENLSWRLKKKLQPVFAEIIHSNEINPLAAVSDLQIWNYAKQNEFLILTNDDDFYKLVTQNGFPPKVILLKTGNLKTELIVTLLIAKIKEIKSFAENNDFGILEIIS